MTFFATSAPKPFKPDINTFAPTNFRKDSRPYTANCRECKSSSILFSLVFIVVVTMFSSTFFFFFKASSWFLLLSFKDSASRFAPPVMYCDESMREREKERRGFDWQNVYTTDTRREYITLVMYLNICRVMKQNRKKEKFFSFFI